jgi:hypothetical protein
VWCGNDRTKVLFGEELLCGGYFLLTFVTGVCVLADYKNEECK